MSAPIKVGIRDGQPYVDEPDYVDPKREFRSPIAKSVAFMFGHSVPDAVQIGWTLVRLHWKTPDGKGNLIPRKGR